MGSYYGIVSQSAGKQVVMKESFWPDTRNEIYPTNPAPTQEYGFYYGGSYLGNFAANPGGQDDQAYYFSQLFAPTQYPSQYSASNFFFVWGEAFDQYWKSDNYALNVQEGPYWGWHFSGDGGTPQSAKPVIALLQSDYTQNYPTTSPAPVLGSDPNANYIQGLFETVLGQAPVRPRWPSMRPCWPVRVSRMQLARDVLMSPEHLEQEVNDFFGAFLNRQANPNELALGVFALESGISELTLAQLVLTSPEFLAAIPTTDDLVQDLFQNLLGRAPTAAELALVEASPLNTANLTKAILNSPEFIGQTVDAVYQHDLGQPADPVGAAVWVAAIESGKASLTTLEATLLSSSQFYSNPLATVP